MAARRRKSKRQFGANSKPPEHVFFLDRSLGRYEIATALRQAGATVEIHDDHFPSEATDEEWLPEIGRRKWVVLTKDDRIRHRATTLAALTKGRVRAFILTGGNLQGREMGQIFVTALRAMNRLASKHPAPFIAKVTRAGKAKLL